MIAFAFAHLSADDGIELHGHQSSNEVVAAGDLFGRSYRR
jgi:hypothetical protein